MEDLIKLVYEHDTHRKSKAKKTVSASMMYGSLWKIKLALQGAKRDQNMIDFKFKRSSTIGTAFHEYAEKVLNEKRPEILTEVYNERVIGDITVSGSCDILALGDDGKYTLGDWKTGYGKERKNTQLNQDRVQLSMYRWLNPDLDIRDEAYTLFISQSNNEQAAYQLDLMSLDDATDYIENKLWAAEECTTCDCFSAPYHPCTYCDIVECEFRKDK